MGKIGMIFVFVIGGAIIGAVFYAISAPIMSYVYWLEYFSGIGSEAQGWTLLAFIIFFIPSIVIGSIIGIVAGAITGAITGFIFTLIQPRLASWGNSQLP